MKHIKYYERFGKFLSQYMEDDIIVYNSEFYTIYYISQKNTDIPTYHCNNILTNYKKSLNCREIDRKATPEEIEDIETKKNADKYNL